MARLRALRDEYSARLDPDDLIELRLDGVADPDVAGALAGRTRQVIITCRARWEGGAFAGSEEERERFLRAAAEQGAEYVDVEWRAGFTDLVTTHRARVVLSSHDFGGVPADLDARFAAMHATGAAVVKLAVTASRLSDTVALHRIARPSFTGPAGHQRSVLIAMGEAGLVTRVLPSRFHSAWTYAGALLNVGQVPLEALTGLYRVRAHTETTPLYGVVGRPVSHSVSPAMHNAAFAAAGYDAVYVPLPAVDVDDLMTFADAFQLQGASVTIPFKVPLLAQVADVDAVARQTGALNTLRRSPAGWSGRNTDVEGFLAPLDARGISLRGQRVCVLGAGGSARAVVLAAASRGAQVLVCARDAAGASRVAALTGASVGTWPPRVESGDLLVNCTPVGMHPHTEASPLDATRLQGATVYDLVYNPQETRLLREARAAGCQVIGGLDMLVAQAAAQCEWWTGRRPDHATMKRAAVTRLAEFSQ